MSNTTATIYGVSLQTAMLRNLPLEYPLNTTLNQKFDILPNAYPPQGQLPIIQYVSIGRGGHKNVTGADGASLNQLNWHMPSDSSLYSPLPFALKAADNDFSSEKRACYGLRKKEIYNEKEYYAYYLKKLEPVNESPKLLLSTVKDGETTTIPYIPSASDINPNPPTLSPEGEVIVSGQFLCTTSPLLITLESQDIDEIVNACMIKYNNKAYAMISEIALVSATTRTVSDEAGGSAISYNEAIACQCCILQCTGPYDLNSISAKLDFSYELGASEMLAL